MQKPNWGTGSQVVSNLAVLIGVVLVVLQLRQNAELLELQILKQEGDSYIEANLMLMEGDYPRVWAKMVEDPQNLTLAETRIIESEIWGNVLTRWRGVYDLYERGLLDKSAWTRMVGEDVPYDLGHPYGRAYWENTRDSEQFSSEFVEFIDQRLAETPYNFLDENYRLQIDRVREIQAQHEKASAEN